MSKLGYSGYLLPSASSPHFVLYETRPPLWGREKIHNNENTLLFFRPVLLGYFFFPLQFFKHLYGSSASGVSYTKLCGYLLYRQVQLCQSHGSATLPQIFWGTFI